MAHWSLHAGWCYGAPHAQPPPGLSENLRAAYRTSARGFGKTNSRCAAGPGATAGGRPAATFAQTLWRFCDNDRVEFPASIAPLVQRVRDDAPTAGVWLAVHDWSIRAFGSHPSKRDRRRLTRDAEVGYGLATVLIVRGTDGAAVAPVSMRLTTAAAVLGTDAAIAAGTPHVDQVRGLMDVVAGLRSGAPVVHGIDREADSVGHWRDWHAAGLHAVVRTDGREARLSAVTDAVPPTDAGAASCRGRPARRFVGEAAVVLHRPTERWAGGRQRAIAGDPLAVRMVVAELRDGSGRVLARWLLPTNVPAAANGYGERGVPTAADEPVGASDEAIRAGDDDRTARGPAGVATGRRMAHPRRPEQPQRALLARHLPSFAQARQQV